MKKIKTIKWSKVVGALEQMIYICPTLATILYYYFNNIKSEISRSSQFTFALCLCLFVIFIIYKKVVKTKIDGLRQSLVQTETDLENCPTSETEQIALLASNAKKKRVKLDIFDKGSIIISLLIFALGVNILEQCLIGLTNLAFIACGSVLVGFGVHVGALELKRKESSNIKGDKK
ncbi:MAG: hypothetical protein RR348_04275 [Clostridia bacterium]